jgi:FecR protein
MSLPRRCTAIKAGLSLALLLIAAAANAEPIGTVTRLEGIVVASRADGSVKVLGVDSAIEVGDILSSRTQTYVAVTLADNSTVTLGPDTDLKIERFVFHKHVPDGDGAVLALANGSVRVTPGVLGTRSSEETFALATPTSTLDIRGASLIVQYVAFDRASLARRETSPRHSGSSNWVPVRYSPGADSGLVRAVSDSPTQRLAQITPPGNRPPGGLAQGLYVQVIDGLINVTNKGGAQSFAAGQFGYVSNLTVPPVVVPTNPGLKFTPPPMFANPSSVPSATSGSSAVDCVVR